MNKPVSDEHFRYEVSRHGSPAGSSLLCEHVEVESLAEKFGTPLYIYSATTIRNRVAAFADAFRSIRHTICYSVKANSNLCLLTLLAKQGCGFDIVSGGELSRVLLASPSAAKKVVFSGVGKTAEEIASALKAGILLFNVESAAEIDVLIGCAAKSKRRANLALRVNPDVFAVTHPYISTGMQEHKFGVPIDQARELYKLAAQSKWLRVAGVSVHIGSQITEVAPFGDAMRRVTALIKELRSDGFEVTYVDAGGGFGIPYQNREEGGFTVRVKQYAAVLIEALRGLKIHLLLEPGRAIMGPAGALLTRVLYTKQNGKKKFVVVDAAMNDLIRPSLYKAYHEIVPSQARGASPHEVVDVVGPICETGDFFARDRELPVVSAGDLLAILDAGAYGMSLSSNYNSRGRPAEVLVDGKKTKLIRKRETIRDLVRAEL